jgi:hypothetical protein
MVEDGRATFEASAALDLLEHVGRGVAHGTVVGVFLVELVQLTEHPERGLEVVRVDSARGQLVVHGGTSLSSAYGPRERSVPLYFRTPCRSARFVTCAQREQSKMDDGRPAR